MIFFSFFDRLTYTHAFDFVAFSKLKSDIMYGCCQGVNLLTKSRETSLPKEFFSYSCMDKYNQQPKLASFLLKMQEYCPP